MDPNNEGMTLPDEGFVLLFGISEMCCEDKNWFEFMLLVSNWD